MTKEAEDPVLAGEELRVEMRLRNNRLWNLIFPRWNSVAAFCRELSLHQVEVGELLNLKPGASPIHKKSGKYRDICEKIATHFHLLPEDIFPLDIYNLKQTSGSAAIGVELLPYYQCVSLPAPNDFETFDAELDRDRLIEQLLGRVTPRERKLLMMRFGLGPYDEHTFEEIGVWEEITQDRARQIVEKAIGRLQRDPKMKRAFYAAEFGGWYVHPDVVRQCDDIDAARTYIDALHDILTVLRKGITDGRGPKLDAWFGLNGCTERERVHRYWVYTLEKEMLDLAVSLCEQPLLREQLERADARELMGFARLHPILHSHRAQVQDLFWAYYRRRR